jgi:hypothetical protein
MTSYRHGFSPIQRIHLRGSVLIGESFSLVETQRDLRVSSGGHRLRRSALPKRSTETKRCAVRRCLDSANHVIRGDIQGAAVVAPRAIGGNAEKNNPQKLPIG